MQKLLVIAGVSTVAAIAQSGEHIRCVGDRAHVLKYDIQGEENNGSSMEGIQSAIVSLEAARQHDAHCVDGGKLGSTPSGDKQLCYGVNQNSDCSGAKETIHLEWGTLECKDCYLAVKADAFYKLDYNMIHLNSVQVGLKDIHVVGSASLHKAWSGKNTFKGSKVLATPDQKYTLIDELVGCPVCVKVKITIAVPTAFEYELDLSAQADMTVGGKIDAHLADHWAKYDSKSGWSYPDYNRNITATPILDIGNMQATANVNLAMRTSVQVNVDDIIWYHLDVTPKLPLTASASGSITPVAKGDFCLKGDAELDIGHEADLDWNLLVWHAKDHWGPTQDEKWAKSGVINYCKSVGRGAEVLV